ncbi:hypothetical protein DXG01_013089 [Tephrocybe rancida]|nr:hypothetical protein DXG01_013089 [Tephrocybe rancida]
MGMKRGGILNDLPGDIALNVRRNLIHAFFKGLWIILPDDDILKELMSALYNRKPWGSVPAFKATTYNYRLFYLEDCITIKDAAGQQCIPGTTVLPSTLHPCLTIPAAHRFFLGQCPGRGKPDTGFDLLQKPEWQRIAFMVFSCARSLNRCCPYTFFITNPELDDVRPTPRFYLDDSEWAKKDGRVMERMWQDVQLEEDE